MLNIFSQFEAGYLRFHNLNLQKILIKSLKIIFIPSKLKEFSTSEIFVVILRIIYKPERIQSLKILFSQTTWEEFLMKRKQRT